MLKMCKLTVCALISVTCELQELYSCEINLIYSISVEEIEICHKPVTRTSLLEQRNVLCVRY